jgi:hypothetical protein
VSPEERTAASLTSCAAAPAGLVAWWPGEGNSTDIQSSNSGILQNGTTFAPGRVGQAFSFDGVDDYVDIADNPSLNLQMLSLEAWINTPAGSVGVERHIFARSGSSGLFGYELAVSASADSNRNGRIRFENNGGASSISGTILFGNTAVNDGQWHHVVATYDGAISKIYIDGQLDTQTSKSITLNYESNSHLFIGTRAHSPEPFSGLIDEPSIYSRALSAIEIQAIYNSGSAGKCATCAPRLTSWWQGEANASDATGSNNGILQNGVTFVPGYVGQAFDFAGSNDYVEIPNNPSINFTSAQDYAVEFFMKAQQHTNQQGTLIEKWSEPANVAYPYAVRMWGTNAGNGLVPGAIECAVYDGSAGYDAISTKTVDDNNWHQVRCEYKHSQKRIEVYIDGQLDSATTYTTLGNIPNDRPVAFGVRPGRGPDVEYNGLLDEVRIYELNPNCATLSSLVLNPTTVTGEQTSTGTITLVNPAPVGGAIINLNSSNTNTATVPGSITIPETETSGTFTVSTSQPANDTSVNITASYLATSRTASLNVQVPRTDLTVTQVQTISVSPVAAGTTVQVTAQIQNLTAVPGTCTVRFYLGSIAAGNLIGQQPGVAVAANGQTNATANWNTDGLLGTYNIIANIESVSPAEDNTANNSATLSNFGVIAASCIPASPGLVSWWPGEGSANDRVEGNSGILQNGATFAPGKVGQAFSLDGVDDFVNTPLRVNYANGVTFEMWVKTTDTDQGTLIADGGGATIFQGMYLGVEPNGKARLLSTRGVNGSSNFDIENGPVTNDGNWHHVAGTWTGDTTVDGAKLYVDGVLVGTGTAIAPVTATHDVNIGGHSAINYGKLQGLIDEPTVYQRALSETEIQAIYNANSAGKCGSTCTPLPSNAAAWFKGEGDASDFFGINNGAPLNGVTYAAGKVGQAFSFNGSSEVDVPDNPNLNVQQFTLNAWVYPTQINDGGMDIIVNKEINTEGLVVQYEIGVRAADDQGGSIPVGNFAFAIGNISGLPSGYRGWVDGGGALPLNTWSFVALTFDGSTASSYVNGQLKRTISGLSGVVPTTSGPFKIGARSGSPSIANFKGSIDEVDLFSRALSAVEIQAIYDADSAGKCGSSCTFAPANLLSWWAANGNANDALRNNNGVLVNGATFTTGKVGEAFSLDDQDDYVDLGQLSQLQDATELTVMAWVKKKQLGRFEGFVGKWNQSGSSNNSFLLYNGESDYIDRGRFVIELADTSYVGISGASNIPVGEWVHVVGTWRSSDGQIRLYKNGVLDGETFGGVGQTLRYHTDYTAKIGQWGVVSNDGHKFYGDIDETQIFTRALSQTEIQSIYNAGSSGVCGGECTGASSQAVSWFPAEGTADDIQGGNHGTLQNGTTFAPGKVGQAFSFDGVDDVVTTPLMVNYANGATFEAWVKTTDSNQGVLIADGGGATIFQGMYLGVEPNGKARFYSTRGVAGQDNFDVVNSPFINDGNWHHVAGTWTGDATPDGAKLYVDGVQVGTSTAITSVTATHPIELGGNDTISYPGLSGLLDEATVYQRALSASEIQTIYSSGMSGKCRGIIQSLILNPSTVTSMQPSTGTVTLSSPAPAGGTIVNLTSSNTNAATVPVSITIPANLASGSFTVQTSVVNANTSLSITASIGNETRTVSLIINRLISDLQVAAVDAPAQAVTDSLFDVSWTDTNNGTGEATATWVDSVYLSTDDQAGGDTLIAEFPFTEGLPAGQSANRIQTINIPRTALVQSGNFFLIVVTDASNSVDEGANEGNNFRAKAIQVTRSPRPDLIVEPNSIVAPDTAFFDQTIHVQWRVKNIGGGATDASEWSDWVYLSTDNIPEIEDPFKLALQNVSYLAAGESYVASADIHIPRGLVGTYNVTVWTDGDGTNHRGASFTNRVLEEDELNNYGLVVRPIQINAAPEPDLQVISVAAPEETFTGGTMSVNWRVENRGDRSTFASESAWVDKIYVSQDQVFNLGVDREVGSKAHSGGLAQNEGYNESGTFAVPSDIAGPYYVFVLTDAADSIYEFTHEDNNANYDRDQPGSPMQIRSTPPDLIVPAMSAPGTGTAANQVANTWTVRNQGAFDATPRWFDTVYLSSSPTLNPATATPLSTVLHDGTLGGGAEYNTSTNVTLPACLSGTYYLFVYTDSRNQIFEYDSQFEAEQNNYSQSQAIQISSLPPDLRVTTVSNAVAGVAGQPTQVSWTVANQGAGPTIEASWTDSVYLIQNLSFTPNNSNLIGTFAHAGTLVQNTDYTRTENVTIPTTAQGNYYIFVVTDVGDTVRECGNDANNTAASSTQINISNSLPDLSVSSIGPVGSAVAGSTVTVQWTGQNTGNAAAQNLTWGDYVYFSNDNVLDGGDLSIGSTLVNGPLVAGATYQAQAQVQLPVVAPDNYFLIVVADNGNNVFEGQNESNNFLATPIQLIVPEIDLQVSNLGAPDTPNSGQDMTVSWTVTNAGVLPTVGSSWTDYVILSRDQILDSTDRTIGFLQHDSALGGGQSYDAVLDVFVPSGFAGQYYVFVKTDWHNQIAESLENNNAAGPKGVMVQLTPPADLVVESVTLPATATPGDPATFSWTVRNNGSNPALGLWQDAVYLSTDQTWDIGDTLVERQTALGPIAPGQSYNGTLTVPLPAVIPGQYYVIIRSDVRNRVRENDETNNNGVSTNQTTVDITELQLGVPRATTLVTGQERYYKVNPPANETMRVSLTGQGGSFNELFTRFGQVASRSSYDFLFSTPYQANQENIVPNTQAGTYYNLIRAEQVPTVAPQDVTVKAELVPFSITSVSPNHIGDNGQVTITIKGAKFEDGDTVQLIQGNTVLIAAKTWLTDNATIKARFFFTHAPRSTYDVELKKLSGENAKSFNAVTIEEASSFHLAISAVGSFEARPGRKLTITNSLRNNSNVDVPYVSVFASFTEQEKIGITRDADTLPKQESMPAADWENDSPTSETRSGELLDSFIVRDLEVNGERTFGINVVGSSTDRYKGIVSAIGISKEEFISPIVSKLLTLRSVLLASGNSFPTEMTQALQTEASWLTYVTDALVHGGILDADDATTIRSATFRSPAVKSRNAGPHPNLGAIQNCQECDLGAEVCTQYNNVSTEKCLIKNLLKGGAIVATVVCVAKYILPVCKIEDFVCRHLFPCPSLPPPGQCEVYITDLGVVSSYELGCKRKTSSDPNDKGSPTGFGQEAFVPSSHLIPYVVNFENVSTATAPAQRIQITDQLDPNDDWRTFRLKQIGFGSYRIEVPENRSFFQQRIQLGADFNNLLADVSAGVDIATGKVTWTLTALDPATGEQPNSATLGLLPPNNAANDGQGFVTYTVQPKASAPTGTLISNTATITFDTNEPMDTNTVTNTLDADSPSSSLDALPPAQTQTTFAISWAGDDPAGGSGLQSYDIWVSESGGPYQPFLSGTTDTSAQYTGQIGKQYRFYSIARDNAGNVEAAPSAPDAVTRVVPEGYSVWQGNASTDWNTATNWIPEGVPSVATFAIIPDTGVANEPLLNAPASVSGLLVETGRSLNLSGDLTVTTSLTLSGGVINAGSNTLILGSAATADRTAGDVSGSLRKLFGGPATFTFPVGTANGYSPVNATVTAGPGELTVRAVQGVQPVLVTNGQSNTSLQRYWTLNGSGITTDLTFNYLAGDVMGNEANYKVIRVSGSIPIAFGNTSANTVNHKGTVTGVSSFSDWTLGVPTAPTAAPATISGQVTTGAGLALGGVVVELSGARSARTITDANGNYRFANVDAGGFYSATPSLVNFTFSPSSRSFSLVANKTDAVFTAVADQNESANPLKTTEYFVRQQYLDFLNREPDQAGLDYWAAQIRQCGTDAGCIRRRRIAVSNAFFFEPEFQKTGAFVYRLYKEAYGDSVANHGYRPAYAQFVSDRARVNPNVAQLAQSLQDLANDFAQRPEFTAKYPADLTAPQFVDAVLETMQKGSGANLQSQREALISEFNLGAASSGGGRGRVLYRLADDNEQSPINNHDFLNAEYNRAFVLTEYFGYLKRDPDQGGYDFWLDIVNRFPLRDLRGQNSMVCAFVTSAEYQQRFSSITSRSNGECAP